MEKKKQYTLKVLALLEQNYPSVHIALSYSNEWELMVAVQLSAQCTDKQVNIVTRDLFKKYPTIQTYAHADLLEFEKDIRSTGFYRNKAKHIIQTAQIIMKEYGGKLPHSMKELIKLPGVARKTANVVQGNAFGMIEGIAVDTHVKRLSQRLGFSKKQDPDKIELDLMNIIPKKRWFSITYQLIELGRQICIARYPHCEDCFLKHICPSAFTLKKT